MKFSVFIKKLSNPRVRKRLKIALSVYAVAIILGIGFKMVYDIGFFNALALEKAKKMNIPVIRNELLTLDSAQRIVSGALKEDKSHPKTIVLEIVNNNRHLSSLIIENNALRSVGWIVDMHLFFKGDVFNEEGYNLTKGIERQHNLNNAGY